MRRQPGGDDDRRGLGASRADRGAGGPAEGDELGAQAISLSLVPPPTSARIHGGASSSGGGRDDGLVPGLCMMCCGGSIADERFGTPCVV